MTTIVLASTIVVMSLAARLRDVRNMAGVSAREVDRLAGLGEGHTAMVERGDRADPSMTTVGRIADVLGVSLEWLVHGRGRTPSERVVRAAVAAATRAERPTGT